MEEEVIHGDTPTKRCTKCGEVKPAGLFNTYPHEGKRYFRSLCRTCQAKQEKKYREENSEKYRERKKRSEARHIEAKRMRQKAWRIKNIEKARAIAKRQGVSAFQRITNSYIANSLKIPVKDLPPEIIELKRQQLQVIRAVKQLKEKANGK